MGLVKVVNKILASKVAAAAVGAPAAAAVGALPAAAAGRTAAAGIGWSSWEEGASLSTAWAEFAARTVEAGMMLKLTPQIQRNQWSSWDLLVLFALQAVPP